MGNGVDVIVPATAVTTGNGVTRVLPCVVLHVMMIVTTDAVDAIRAVDVTTIADVTITVDATKAAGVTAEGITAVTATLTPRMKAVTGPDPTHGTGIIAHYHDLIRAPGTGTPGGLAGARRSTSLTIVMKMPPMSMKGTV